MERRDSRVSVASGGGRLISVEYENFATHFLKLAPTALALSMAGLFNGGCVTSTTTTNEPVRFRVMSYNIHHGKDLTARWTSNALPRWSKRSGGHCGLQEVDKGVERTKRRDLPAELAALTA